MCVHVSVVNYSVVKIGYIKQMRKSTELAPESKLEKMCERVGDTVLQ